jgi:hypothetical protein
MLFGAFPIVYQQDRGWSQGIGGLAFLGVAVGMLIGVGYSIVDNKRYARVEREHGGEAPPEARLPPAMAGAIALPIGMFWFGKPLSSLSPLSPLEVEQTLTSDTAWTNYPSIHWIVSIIGTAPFGFGMVLVFLSCMNYLIDSYTIYAASVLAANSVLRSLFGAAFPLFTTQMYSRLGIHWASSIPAFLALACLPFPFVFYKVGERIRMKCKYAAQAHRIMEQMKQEHERVEEKEEKKQEGEGELEQRQGREGSDDASSDDTVGVPMSRPATRRSRSHSIPRNNALVQTHSYSSHHVF